MMKLILVWHRFAVKYFIIINVILFIFAGLILLNLKDLSFNGNWLDLFSGNDLKYADYEELVIKNNVDSSLYIKLESDPAIRPQGLINDIKRIEGVSFARKIQFKDRGSNDQWLEAGVRDEDTVKAIDLYFKASDLDYGLTGAIPILNEYTESVKTDFVKTSVIALGLILLIILCFFGFSLWAILGFIYQAIGLLVALYIFKLIYGGINSLAATLPCVLIGLGIDFVIHSVVAIGDTPEEGPGNYPGEAIYRKVAVPIFWGAVTTALAFLSLLFVDLKGLHSAGILGSLSIVGMFLFVILFLPAAVSWRGKGNRRQGIRLKISLPFIGDKKLIGAIILFLVCISLISFAGRARFEDQIENLRDKDMISLRLQDELTDKLGVYPSRFFISFEAADPMKELRKFSKYQEIFLPNPKSVKFQRLEGQKRSKVTLQVFPRENPFSPDMFKKINTQLLEVFSDEARQTLRITGDSVLYHHLNRLLIKGMSTAFLAVFLFLAVVLLILFKSVRFATSALAVLFISTLATIGGFGIFSISLSIYTITLFPLFIGIGVDDCLHIAYLKRRGGKLASNSPVLKAIALTTITTLLCYGSLITAKNAGFTSIGRAAILGLSLMFLCTVYFLPVLLGKRSK